MTRRVLDPRPAWTAGARERRGLASAQFLFRDVRREFHDEAVIHQADEHAPAGVTGRTPEHPADSEAAMMLDELGEKRLKIRSKRNRHARSDCKLLLLLLQQRPFPLDSPAIAAKPAVLLHHAMAGDHQADVIGRAGPRHGACGARGAYGLLPLPISRG